MDTTEILKKVRKIEIKTRGLSKQVFSGEYQSAFKGRGMSFSEVRDYHYGDDVRNIDWNVTARTGTPFVKVFEEERELTLMLVVDISQSSLFGTKAQFKSDLVTEMSAVLAFSAIQNNDKVGAILFSSEIEKYIPPKKGKSHILRIIREIIFHKPEHKGTDIEKAIRYLTNVQKKRSIAFVLSDFMDQGYDNALTIASRRHDVVGIHTYDQSEVEMPNVGLLRVIDPETGDLRTIDTSNKSVRNAYQAAFADNEAYFKETFMKLGSDIISIATGDDYVKSLLQFFKKRTG